MPCPCRPVELPGRHEHAALGEPLRGVPAGLAAGGPQVQAGFRVVDPETGGGDRRPQLFASHPVPLPLLDLVGIVGQGRGHGRLHGQRHHQPGVLAHLEQFGHERRVTGHEPGPVRGEIRCLGQRMQGQESGVIPLRDPGIQDRRRLALPGQPEIALVRGHDDTAFASPAHDLPQVRGPEDLAGRIGRRVQVEQGRRRGAELHEGVRADHRAARKQRAHLVGRVRHLGDHDRVARPQPELGGQPGDELLGADRRQDGVRRQTGDPVTSGQCVDDRAAQRRGARGGGVAGLRRVRGEGLTDDRCHGVDGRADREIDQPVGVCAGPRPRLGEGVPGEHR